MREVSLPENPGCPGKIAGLLRQWAPFWRRRPAHLWTIWIDGDAAPLHRVPQREQAERILRTYPDHDYMYIASPTGTEYAWNCFRECWEEI